MSYNLELDDWVSCTNNEDHPIAFRYGKSYPIKAHGTAMIPFTVAKHYYGDPRSQKDKYRRTISEGTYEWIESRENQIKKLSVMYGVYNPANISGAMEMADGGMEHKPGIKDAMWDVTIKTMEGEDITFPCDDPDCSRSFDTGVDVSAEQDMKRRMHDLQNQLLTLQQLIENGSSPDQAAQVIADTAPRLDSNDNLITDDPSAVSTDNDELPTINSDNGVEEDRPPRTGISKPTIKVPIRG